MSPEPPSQIKLYPAKSNIILQLCVGVLGSSAEWTWGSSCMVLRLSEALSKLVVKGQAKASNQRPQILNEVSLVHSSPGPAKRAR